MDPLEPAPEAPPNGRNNLFEQVNYVEAILINNTVLESSNQRKCRGQSGNVCGQVYLLVSNSHVLLVGKQVLFKSLNLIMFYDE